MKQSLATEHPIHTG